MKQFYYLGIILFFCLSCNDEVVPKPKGYLRLEYPAANYMNTNVDGIPFSFSLLLFLVLRYRHKRVVQYR